MIIKIIETVPCTATRDSTVHLTYTHAVYKLETGSKGQA